MSVATRLMGALEELLLIEGLRVWIAPTNGVSENTVVTQERRKRAWEEAQAVLTDAKRFYIEGPTHRPLEPVPVPEIVAQYPVQHWLLAVTFGTPDSRTYNVVVDYSPVDWLNKESKGRALLYTMPLTRVEYDGICKQGRIPRG